MATEKKAGCQLGRLQLNRGEQRSKYGVTFQELSRDCKRVYFRLYRAVRRHPDYVGKPKAELFDVLRYVVQVRKKIDSGRWDWPKVLHGYANNGKKMEFDLSPFLS